MESKSLLPVSNIFQIQSDWGFEIRTLADITTKSLYLRASFLTISLYKVDYYFKEVN